MSLRTVHRKFVVCPHCGEKHGDCSDWVKNMPHWETCCCGERFLCWFETETVYFAEAVDAIEQPQPKVKKKKKKAKDKKRKKQKR